jgi:hypothetical protein
MTTELWLLVASVILGLVHLIAASHLISLQHGYRWTASAREEPLPPLRGLQAGCTLRGDIEAPQLVVNENAKFLGSAKVGTGESLRPDLCFRSGLAPI